MRKECNLISTQPLPLEQRARISYDAYILGPGDGLEIELVDLPELSGRFAIGPDGTLYLPRLRALYVEGLTVEELRAFLTEQFRAYVIDPQVYVRPIAYRPIRVYVGGEVKRPGYYTYNLSRVLESSKDHTNSSDAIVDSNSAGLLKGAPKPSLLSNSSLSTTLFPTVFDAIRTAQGITPYSNLTQVQVTRRQAMTMVAAACAPNSISLSLITEGDESQNIRLLDGDVVNVGRSAHGAARAIAASGSDQPHPPVSAGLRERQG